MDFCISGLDPTPFRRLYGRTDAELSALGARRYVVDAQPGFPDRITLRDLEPGRSALLVNFTHLDVDSPYRASHAIFVEEGATRAYEAVNEVPEVLRRRELSVRAFDRDGWMRDALLVAGTALEDAFDRVFADRDVAFVHVHYAVRGCYAARVTRASAA